MLLNVLLTGLYMPLVGQRTRRVRRAPGPPFAPIAVISSTFKELAPARTFPLSFVQADVSKANLARPRPLHTPTAGSSPPSCNQQLGRRSADEGSSISNLYLANSAAA